MAKEKICPFVAPNGTECREKVSSQGLWGHLKGHALKHGLTDGQIQDLMKSAVYAPTPEEGSPTPPPIQTPPAPQTPEEGGINQGSSNISTESEAPPTPKEETPEKIPEPEPPEVQMINEMVARLETEIRPIPGMSPQVATYIIHRFKSEPILQEDPNTLQKMISRASPKSAPEFIATAITNTFQIKQDYNLNYLDSLRNQPNITGTPPNPSPFYPQQLPQTASAQWPYNQQTTPQNPQQMSPEMTALLNEVKSLKSEMEKKDKDDKHRQELEATEKRFQTLIEQQKKEMVELKKSLEGNKDEEKFRELEGYVSQVNSKMEQNILSLKDILTNQTFDQKEKEYQREIAEKDKEHNRTISDLTKKIEDIGKEKKGDLDYFEKMQQYEEKMNSFAKMRGYEITGKKDAKSEIISNISKLTDKISETVLSEDNTDFSPPTSKGFKAIGHNTIEKLKSKAIQKTEQEIAEKEAEVRKMEEENLKLKQIEQAGIEAKKKAEEAKKTEEIPPEEKTPPPPKSSPKETPEPKTPDYDSMSYNDIQKAASEKGIKVVGKGITKEKLIKDLKNIKLGG